MSNLGIDFGNRMSSVTNEFSKIRENQKVANELSVSESPDSKASSFGDYLARLASEANQAQLTADKKIEDVAVGRNKDLHGAMLSVEKADVQFRLLTQVRNKVIEAYREIMRMQV